MVPPNHWNTLITVVQLVVQEPIAVAGRVLVAQIHHKDDFAVVRGPSEEEEGDETWVPSEAPGDVRLLSRLEDAATVRKM